MARVYQCHMLGYDEPDKWIDVPSQSPLFAAQRYARICDSNSAGELFEKDSEKQKIRVKDKYTGLDKVFEISFYYEKEFYAEEIELSANS